MTDRFSTTNSPIGLGSTDRNSFSATAQNGVLSPRISPEFVITIAALLDQFPSLAQLTTKYSLTPFKTVSAPLLQTFDREVLSNPDIIDEGCSFLEVVGQLSVFYTEPSERSYLEEAYMRMVSIRTPPVRYNPDNSLAPETMSEFFIQNDGNQSTFFRSNPYIFGLYMFVFFWTVTQFKGEK